MAETRQVPAGVDAARPSSARIYDYLLGGDHSFESDRAAAQRLQAQMPELIDFSAPVGLMMTAVLHFVSDEADPKALIARYLSAVGSGSYLAMSHRTTDHKPPLALLFDGLELVAPYEGAEPDVAWVGLWGCEDPVLADSEGSRWLYCGVARKP